MAEPAWRQPGSAKSGILRHIGFRRRRSLPRRPFPRVASNGVIAALLAEAKKLLVDPDQRQLLAGGLATVAVQKRVELILPRTDLRLGLPLAFLGERGFIRSKYLADRVPRQVQFAASPLDRPPLHMKRAPNPGNRIHRHHPHTIRSLRRADGRKSTHQVVR